MNLFNAGAAFRHISGSHLPILIALVALLVGGVFLLDRADAQARDTIRKHHLEDIEQALYLARGVHGTFPPYDQPTWCGQLDSQDAVPVLKQIEQALRTQNEKYANLEKPMPTDPDANNISLNRGYFYWKRSPAVFELYSALETDPNGERSTVNCPDATPVDYDYGITSVWRENT
jgi:hypothetical protein